MSELDEILKGFCRKLGKFAAQYNLHTKEFITYGFFDGLLFTFEHYLEQEESCISFNVSSRIKSLKSDEILCDAIGLDKPDLDFSIFNEYAVRSFPFSFKSTEFSDMQELQDFALDDMPDDSYHGFLESYQKSIESLIQAFKIDTPSIIQGLYDCIYKYEGNQNMLWSDKTLMQVLLLIELKERKQALGILKYDTRTNDERKFFIEYDDGNAEIFDILISYLE
ncbi:hypothetical protein [uncultured Brachyspira sp.]|uniref:hypothetical protein n=1 Tax=uncultured Brachyspira sp. TaxID=221953 RepID=UPI00260C0715|nr:hypothetical protein [uncultured Brachyspira sp.]